MLPGKFVFPEFKSYEASLSEIRICWLKMNGFLEVLIGYRSSSGRFRSLALPEIMISTIRLR